MNHIILQPIVGNKSFPSLVLQKLHVTGTPYRGDGQEIPGVRIHETPLSEVMRDRYVKYLKKKPLMRRICFHNS